jgi:CBS domain-containing protein
VEVVDKYCGFREQVYKQLFWKSEILRKQRSKREVEMKVKDIMTADPACCTAESSLEEAARLMIDHDCGEIPVVDDLSNGTPVGVITDRDITCRTVGKGLNPLDLTVGDVMSTPLISVTPTDTLEQCMHVLEEHQIRRVPVVDGGGKIVGIVALADIARTAPKKESAEVLKEVSAASASASNIT